MIALLTACLYFEILVHALNCISKSARELTIVEFRIPGYPGPSKEQGTEVRLMRGKIFCGKIRM